jgi:Zn-dependent protease with chaperone function
MKLSHRGRIRVKASAFFQKLPGDRPVLGILAGSAFFLLASILRALLGDISEGFGPMTLLPSILLAGLFGGIRIGLAFGLLCALVGWVFFFPPYGTFVLATGHKITMAVFMVTAALELYVIRSLNISIYELSEAREHSNTLFRELQHRVANKSRLRRCAPEPPEEGASRRQCGACGARCGTAAARHDVARASPAA